MKILIKLVLSITLLLFISCGEPQKEEAAEIMTNAGNTISMTTEQREMAGIETGFLVKRLMADVIDCTGFIDVPPTNKATVHAPINGLVQEINVMPGSNVSENQELAVIADQDIATLKENFLDQRSNLAYWESELQRKEKLYAQEAISKKDYLSVQNRYNNEKYTYQSLKEQLAMMGIPEEELIRDGINLKISIKAPIKGYIAGVFVNIGSFVDEVTRMFEIINYDHVHLELLVYSNDINKIAVGQRVRFNIAGSGKGGWGTIRLIGRKVDDVNRSVLVHAHIDEYDQQLTIGSSIIAEILTAADSTYCLPESAVVMEGNSSFIFSEDQEGFNKITVKTGRVYDGYVEILNYADLKATLLVTSGAYYLTD